MQNIWDNWKLTERIISLVRLNHVTRNRKGRKFRTLHLQGWVDTDRQGIPHIQNAGFASNAGTGSRTNAVTLDVEADPVHQIAILVADEDPPQPDEGCAIFYAPGDSSNQIKLSEDGGCISLGGEDLLLLLSELAGAGTPAQAALVQRFLNMRDC